ncbi:protein of unknown function [Candidatus Methylocalor cossyra]|uniref:VanZ-like domain-containing protein n=1 Tax=Candidatus Methylocalor cossyra TaxID=3108543 RepID=A0ABM9NJQ4_9GAMM
MTKRTCRRVFPPSSGLPSLLRLVGPDKLYHILVSRIIFLLLVQRLPLMAGILITLAVGLLKELWDHYYGSGFCWADLVANKIGIVITMAIYYK